MGVVALAMLLAGCGGGPKSSSGGGPQGTAVPTSQIYLYLTVESTDGRNAVVRANLNDGKVFGANYRLDGGDFLRACVGGFCRGMTDNDSVFTPDYIARFDYQPGIDYVVSFNRQQTPGAPDSRVALPPDFSIVTPASRQPVTDGDTVLVSWSPNGAPARVELSYDAECTFQSGSKGFSSGTLGADADADGSEPVRVDPIVSFAQTGVISPISRCSIDVIVRHELDGRIDPAFDDGIAVGSVSREINLDYIPR
jgi:hypothetical protein